MVVCLFIMLCGMITAFIAYFFGEKDEDNSFTFFIVLFLMLIVALTWNKCGNEDYDVPTQSRTECSS